MEPTTILKGISDIAELVADGRGDLGRRLGRDVVPESRRRPLRERLVEPRVARLVVADERVEPLVRRLVRDDLRSEIGAHEHECRVLLAQRRPVSLDDDGVGAPRVGRVALRERGQRVRRRIEERARHGEDRRRGSDPHDDGRRDVDGTASNLEPSCLESEVAHRERPPAPLADADAARKHAHPLGRRDLHVEVGDGGRPRLQLRLGRIERPLRPAPRQQREEGAQPDPESGAAPSASAAAAASSSSRR